MTWRARSIRPYQAQIAKMTRQLPAAEMGGIVSHGPLEHPHGPAAARAAAGAMRTWRKGRRVRAVGTAPATVAAPAASAGGSGSCRVSFFVNEHRRRQVVVAQVKSEGKVWRRFIIL